uniref:Temporin-1Tr n=1 Tax=Rana temporaria TaxID=8407 RepID=TPR_RANTE|nr:RecName: Full=Temporin-1Tr; AltName: Full=Temporin-R [Rana temporaria]
LVPFLGRTLGGLLARL